MSAESSNSVFLCFGHGVHVEACGPSWQEDCFEQGAVQVESWWRAQTIPSFISRMEHVLRLHGSSWNEYCFEQAAVLAEASKNTFLCFEYGALRGRVEAYRTNIVSDKGPVLWVTLVSVDTCWSRTLVGIDSKQLSCRILLFWGLKVDVDMR